MNRYTLILTLVLMGAIGSVQAADRGGFEADALPFFHAHCLRCHNDKQAKADELGRVAEWISRQLKEGEASRMARRGPVTLNRFSRDEYSKTVYDLLGGHFDGPRLLPLPSLPCATIWDFVETSP